MGRPIKTDQDRGVMNTELSEEAQEKIVVSVNEEEKRKDKAVYFQAKKKDQEIVEVVVENLLHPGVFIEGGHGGTDNHKTFCYAHGAKVKMPRERARFIESLKIPDYQYIPDGNGAVKKAIVGYIHRFSCKQAY